MTLTPSVRTDLLIKSIQALGKETNEAGLLQTLVKNAGAAAGARSPDIYLWCPEPESFTLIRLEDPTVENFPFHSVRVLSPREAPELERVRRTSHPLVIARQADLELPKDMMWQGERSLPYQGHFPLLSQGRAVGVMSFDVIDLPKAGVMPFLIYVGSLVNLVAMALETSLLREQLGAALKLTSAVAHEVNQPLTVILGHVQLMFLAQDAPEVRGPVEIIYAQTKRIAEIVRRLSGLNQITAARMKGGVFGGAYDVSALARQFDSRDRR
ncbi:MAG: hypothetical protein HY783_06050 [Chloroflexi bacterium]|nr:hypothetical protein [Chloroflexota bacterium]